MKILVTGATGSIGRHVVDQLVRVGADVRALTRDPAHADFPAEVEVMQGDLMQPATLSAAMQGVDRIYLFPVHETAREVVGLAKQAGARRIVDLSAASVTIGLHDNPVEAAVEESGLEWTHVRPSEFMGNLLPIWAPSIRAERVVRYPFGDEAGVPVHEMDIAAVVAAALLEDRHVGAAYTLTGPAPITIRERVLAIGEVLGEEVCYEEVTREQARAIMKAQGGFAAMYADFLLGFVDYSGDQPAGADGYSDDDYSELLKPWPDVQRATLRPARSYAEWACDHVEDFR